MNLNRKMKKLEFKKENLRLLASIIADATSGSMFTRLLTDAGWSLEMTKSLPYQEAGKNKEDYLFDEFQKIGSLGRPDILDYIVGKTVSKSTVYFKTGTKGYKFTRDQFASLKKKLKIDREVKSKANEKAFDERKFHKSVVFVSKGLFVDGHYSQSIFEACKLLNKRVQEKSNLSEDGKALMLKAFSPNRPLIKLSNASSRSETDEQEGFMHIFAGVVQGIRNPKGHDLIIQKDKIRTLEYLSLVSILFRRLDESI
jgi:uncharacterized protein (TIGR02391 family)